MPSTTPRSNTASSTGVTSGSNSGTGSGTSTSPAATSWNYLSNVSTNISLNESNLTNSYIIGLPVENFLAVTSSSGNLTNFTGKSYCVVVDFTISGYQVQLRSVAVPISYYDFSAKKTVRVLRVDFNEVATSDEVCDKPLMSWNASGVLAAEANPPASAINASGYSFDLGDVCSSCAIMFNSSKVRLFLSAGTQLQQVATSSIDVSGLSLSVDPSNNSNTPNPSCTNASCSSTGYSCCLDNQCVTDGAIRSSAYTNFPNELAIVEEQKKTNPTVYKNYPQLYYVCASTVPTDPSTTSGSTSGSTTGGTTDPYAQINADYNCIQEIKSHTTSDPFNNEFLNTGFTFTGSVCDTSSATASNYYKTVMERLYSTCGCLQTSLLSMVNNCPAYDYRKDSNNIVECYIQQPTTTNPVTYQNVNLPSRSAPHRYFNTNGVEQKLASATLDQEGQSGELFEYVDDNKLLYGDTAFSMKAILGNFSRTLDQAHPAVQVDIEADHVYLLSTMSGYFTPCPNCGKDSWFNNFSAFPTSSYGTGLQATGHTTERDSWSTNSTGGNYEDTIFGRACWVPPTMLPFSHKALGITADLTDLQRKSQRLERLKAQAALYANGYQRDWYGFNKGAIIGSFDGVSWFAIGKGRIVRSTSKKLFLAINAPFADVSSPTTNVVNVQSYDGLTQATELDYDPTYHQSHALQNEAGNCQYYHQCNVDSDCITKLGWEYACADVNGVQTTWPKFDVNGNETGESQVIGIEQILQQKRFAGSSTKRCVYRGMGSICHTNPGATTFTSTSTIDNLNKRKIYSCAPNFYCSPLSSNNFNTKVARWANTWEEIGVNNNHTYGREANILGRPREYMGTETLGALDGTIPASLRASFATAIQGNLGLCRPGKNLPTTANAATMWNPFEQHKLADTSKRTDFINQIASCNSGLFASSRHASCPVLDASGNYIQYTIDFAAMTQSSYQANATRQNACGLESLDETAVLTGSLSSIQAKSPFKNIESTPLHETTVLNPTLVRDACLRRAGSVCHTDLDCSPNKFHATEGEASPLSFFGNTPEREYWEQYLVCGQQSPKPLPSETEDFKNYNMAANRCCREVGKDITSYTPYSPLSAKGDAASTDTTETRGLYTLGTPGMNPNYKYRYSRYSSSSETGDITANDDRTILGDNRGQLNTVPNIVSSTNQWKKLGSANSNTCCGGGWIRKFSDGTTDWSNTTRLSLDIQNFQCINYKTPLMTGHLADMVVSTNGGIHAYYTDLAALNGHVQRENGEFCQDPTTGACSAYNFTSSSTEAGPTNNTNTVGTFFINTLAPDFQSTVIQTTNFFYPPLSADSNSATTMTNLVHGTAGASETSRQNFNFFVPIYVTDQMIGVWQVAPLASGYVQVIRENSTTNNCAYLPTLPDFIDPKFNQTAAGGNLCSATGSPCCWKYTADRRLRVFLSNAFPSSTKYGVRLKVDEAGGKYGFQNVSARTLTPGNDLYYLNRLGRLELSGIPQIAHEPLVCTSNANRLVPGLYKSPLQFYRWDSAGADTPTTTFRHSNNSFFSNLDTGSASAPYNGSYPQYTNYKGLAIDPVFSDKDFKCCTPLGKETKDSGTCCSGFGVASTTSSGKYKCMLPVGADISIYFNRYVSNEGKGSDQPGGGLVDADFEAKTGEPKITNAVNQKLASLGAAYCASGKTRQGGAFGSFKPEPVGPRTQTGSLIYGIVDSNSDSGNGSNAGQTVNTGYNAFSNGYRWNHHLYCYE